MKLLFVTNNVPYPPTDGWKIRVWALLSRLAPRHDVSVVSFMRTTEDAAALEAIRAHGIAIEVVRRSPSYSPLKLVRGLIEPRPFSVLNFEDARMADLVRRTLGRHAFDIVQAESLQVSQYCVEAPACRVVDLHNIESVLMRRYAEQATHPLKRAYAALTWRKLDRYERRIYGRFAHCLTCSENDRAIAVAQAPDAAVHVIPNGVDLDAVPQPGRPAKASLLFVGRMDYHANIDGMLWFMEHVWPALQARHRGLQLTIVGGHPVDAIRRLAVPGLIDVTGSVPDVRPYLRDAAVVIVPLRVGGGTRLKVLEAMGMAKPIVATTVGAEGVALTHGKDALLVDAPDAFTSAVTAVLSDPAYAERLGRQARRLAEAQYGWDAIVSRLEALYEASRTGARPQAPMRSAVGVAR